jgi:hypothetical protein
MNRKLTQHYQTRQWRELYNLMFQNLHFTYDDHDVFS